jgi:hypothetical protein
VKNGLAAIGEAVTNVYFYVQTSSSRKRGNLFWWSSSIAYGSMIESTSTPKVIEPKLLSACHFSALQPLLSTGYSVAQVKSLLALALLFWQKPNFSDTQIADSPLLYNEFINPASETLAPLVRECLKSGEARLLMRDGFYANPTEKIVDCANLMDVFHGWKKQNIANAWVVPHNAPNRERFVGYWNSIVPQEFTVTYDYLHVKGRFQQLADLMHADA